MEVTYFRIPGQSSTGVHVSTHVQLYSERHYTYDTMVYAYERHYH
jgi:hypothetical protein